MDINPSANTIDLNINQALFDGMPLGAVYQAADGAIIAANPAALNIFGISLDQMREKNALDQGWRHIYEDGTDFSSADYPGIQALRTGQPVRNVVMGVVNPKNSATLWISINAMPLQSSSIAIVTIEDITARKQADKIKQESQQLFHEIFHASPTAIVLSRLADGRFVEVNESFLKLTERTRDEVIGLTSTEAGILADPDVREEYLHVVEQTGRPQQFEVEIRQKSGGLRNGLVTVKTVSINDRQFAVSTLIDITEQRQAEKRSAQMTRLYKALCQVNQTIMRVKDRNEFYRAICHEATQFGQFIAAWVGLLDEDGNVTPVEAAGLDMAHWPFEPINIHADIYKRGLIATAINTATTVTSADIAVDLRVRTSYDQFARFGFHAVAVLPIRCRGKTISILTLISNEAGLFNVPEELALLDEMAMDISYALDSIQSEFEHKRAEQDLRESEDNLKKSQAVAHVGHWVWSAETNLVKWSDEMQRIFGIPPQSFTGDMNAIINQVIHPDDRDIVTRANENVRHGQRPVPLEYRVVWPDQSVHTVWARPGEKTVDANGNILRLTGIVQDISERKQVEADVEKQLRRLSALRAIDMAISSGIDMRVTLNLLLDHAAEQLHIDAAVILLLNPGLDELEYAAGHGFSSGSTIARMRLKLGEGYAGRAALENRTIIAPVLTEADRFIPNSNLNFVSLIAVPLVTRGLVNGVMVTLHHSRMDPEPEWLEFLHMLAGQSAIAIESSRMFDDLRRANVDLSLAYEATIEGWSSALDLRDKETEGHSQRVTTLTIQLAQAMGMSLEQITHVRRGALLHDIGKLGIPDAVLFKPSALNAEEWAIMQLHPQYAYNVLSSIEYLQPALDIPYCHHEHWDGNGYPRGLKGEQIPLAARLFAVVDVWDALRSDRPYRSGWPDEQVLAYIQAGSGTHFEPGIVDLFFKVIKDNGYLTDL